MTGVNRRFRQEIGTAEPGAVIVCADEAQRRKWRRYADSRHPEKRLTFRLATEDWEPDRTLAAQDRT